MPDTRVYVVTRMAIEGGRWVRTYEDIPAVDGPRPADRTTLPRRPGDPPRIFIVGPQRARLYDNRPESELECRFAEAHAALRAAGYEGISIRLVPVVAHYRDGLSIGATISPGGGGAVPDSQWQPAVRTRMQHCRGVSLLPGIRRQPNIRWELRQAAVLGRPVRPLGEWTSKESR